MSLVICADCPVGLLPLLQRDDPRQRMIGLATSLDDRISFLVGDVSPIDSPGRLG
jgi:hypothetical protein